MTSTRLRRRARRWRWRRRAARAGQAERRRDDRGSGVDRARGRRRSHHRRVDRARATRIRTSSKPSRASSSSCSGPTCSIVVGRELEIGWLPPLIQQSRNCEDSARRGRLSRRVAAGADSRHPAGADHARDGRRASARQPALLARSGERQDRSRSAIAGKLAQLRPGDKAYFDQRLADFIGRLDAAEKRWLAAMAPYKGAQGRHLSPVVSELRRSLRPRRHRLRRAAAGHSAVAAAHARSDQRDEAAERQADPGRAVLRSEDAERDRRADRRAGAGAAAVGRRRQGDHRLHQAVRLRHQPAASTRSSRRGAK